MGILQQLKKTSTSHDGGGEGPPLRAPERGGFARRTEFLADRVWAVDIETVVDEALIPPDWPADKFPKALWHRIVAISLVEAKVVRSGDGETFLIEECLSFGRPEDDEATLLREFWAAFAAGRPRLVTWNGRSFDTPVLRLRAMLLGIDISAWYASGTPFAGYGHRYSPAWHCDVMEHMADYGAGARLSLQEISAALGLPGKIGGSGGSVAAMMAAGQVRRVRDYCEVDVLLTFVVYAHWAAAIGVSNASAMEAGFEALEKYINTHRSRRGHLGLFRDGWARERPAASSPVPYQAPLAPPISRRLRHL